MRTPSYLPGNNPDLHSTESSTSPTTTIKVGVVDDHISVTSAFAVLLNDMEGIECTLEAYSGEEALELLRTAKELPDILLMDVEMPGMGGIEATRQITALYPDIKIIAFTQLVDEGTVRQMIGAGVCAYMTKYVRRAHIEMAMRKVHESEKYHADLFYLYGEGFVRAPEALTVSFSTNEIKYLQLLCMGYTYREIAEEMFVSRATINYYKKCLKDKLGTENLIVMAFEALRLGLVSIDHKRPSNNVHLRRKKS